MNFLRISSGHVDLMETKDALAFDPESRSTTVLLQSLQSLPEQSITFDVKVTHPDFLQAQPRDGVIVGGGGTAQVVLQLLNLKGLDVAGLTAAPMRVMISASSSHPLGSQKVKLLCNAESIANCLGRRRGTGGGAGSNPSSRSSTPPPVLARKTSGAALVESPPPPLTATAQQSQTHVDPPAASPSPVPTADAPPPSTNTTAPAVAADHALCSNSSSGGTFGIHMVLGQLRLPSTLSGLLPPGAMCCLQWKRGLATGTTQWYPVQATAASSSAHDSSAVAVCNFGGEQIAIPRCEPSSEKRVLFALGVVTVDPTHPNASSLRGTLKLDASRPTNVAPEDAAFPVTLDGRQGAVLTASLSMLSDSVGQGPARASTTEALTSTQPQNSTSDATPSTPPPAPRYTGNQVHPLSPKGSNPLSPRSRAEDPANAPASSSSRKLLEPSSLSALRSQLGSLDSTLRASLQPLSPTAAGSGTVAEGSNASSTTKVGSTPLVAATPRGAGAVSTNPLRTFEKQMPKSSNVLVAVRIRPRLPFEQAAATASPTNADGTHVGEAWAHDKTTIRATANDRQYQFDVVFPPQTTTQHVFDTLCPPFIENALLGINGTIFMYGQTASGKTHTMFGSEQEAGITPQVIGALFREIEVRKQEFEDLEVHVVASYFEIYNEELNDLLDLGKKNLQVRSSGSSDGGGFTVDVSSVPIRTKEEAMQVLVHGSYNKKIGQSHLNDRSSRSHSIFKLGIEVIGAMVATGGGGSDAEGAADTSDFGPRRKSVVNGGGSGKTQRTLAELCLVDLAGSETLQEKSGTSQRKETTNINLSLTYLKKVIWELAHKEKHVSYRNSTLTKVLKQAVGGNSRTCVVCCITPAPEHFRDSRNTLVFGTTAKSVVTTTRVNATGGAANDSAELVKLRAELVRMRGVLEAYDATVQAYGNMEDDFRRVLEENTKLEEQVDELEAENETLRSRQQQEAVQQPLDDKDGAVAPRFSLPTARNSALLRADAEQHAALLEEAISRLNQVSVAEDDDDTSDGRPAIPPRKRRSPQPSPSDDAQELLEEQRLEDDDPFDEVDDDSTTARRPAAPKSRPPPTNKPVRKGPVTAPRSVESLQLQLIQQTIDHRVAMQKKDEELERMQEQQVRPTDEIPEIMKKEEKVCLLLDQLHNFLHHGTPMRLVYTGESPISSNVELSWVGSSLPRNAPRIGKVFMYLYTHHQKETYLCFCLVDAEDSKLPKRSSCFEKIPIKDIKRVELGQYSEPFEKLRQWGAALTPSSTDDEHSELCRNLLDRQRMSFTVLAKKGKQYECVCEDEADFEAWVIELNRLLGTSAEWKQPLAIAHMQFFDVLDDAEKAFCASMHIHPDEYVRAKNKMLKRKEKFVTLFDVRSLAQFDLYHSQRFFYFLRCQGWVSQAALFYLTEKFVASAQPDLDEL